MPRLCDDYLSLYCQAAGNIRENTGDTVPEATLRLLVNKMLEEVGAQCTRERQNGVSSVLSVSSVLEFLSPTLPPLPRLSMATRRASGSFPLER